jgi:AcrR family transcriptional regulator
MARTRRFDEERLLECALDAFWRNGYDRTSIDDVSTASGVGNGSIYAAYGSKLGLFLAVFSRYCENRVELVEGALPASPVPFEQAVAHYLDVVVADCTAHDDRRGCLMLNSLTDLATRFPEVVSIGRAAMDRMNAAVGRRVRQAAHDGELSLEPGEEDALAAHIVLVSQGLIQLSRIGVEPARLREIAATATRSTARRAA